jgi:hypothetical protein
MSLQKARQDECDARRLDEQEKQGRTQQEEFKEDDHMQSSSSSVAAASSAQDKQAAPKAAEVFLPDCVPSVSHALRVCSRMTFSEGGDFEDDSIYLPDIYTCL